MDVMETEPEQTFAEDWRPTLAYQLPQRFSVPSSSERPVLLWAQILAMFCNQCTLDKIGKGIDLALLANASVGSGIEGKNFSRKTAV